jgi:hypothetical protein
MKNLSIKIPFDSTPGQTKEAFRKLMFEVHKNRLGRAPRKDDKSAFKQTDNPDNSSIKDFYFRGKKIGSVATTYTLDMPREITLDYRSKS